MLKHLREFGFGRKSMATIIEEEARSLVEHFKKLINDKHNNQINESKICCNNNDNDNGKIYKLIKKDKANELESMDKYTKSEKQIKASDLYINADEYMEVKMAQPRPEIVIPMHDAFGVTVLNTLWRMMASKRLFFLCNFKVLLYFI